MKRIVSVLMVLSMLLCLCACSGGGQTKKDGLKVGLICLHDENSGYDNNFITAFKSACEKNGVEYLIKTNIPEGAECKEAALDFADNGCTLIISDSYGHQDYMIEAAKECPEVQFVSCTGDKANTIKMDNFHNAFASIYEGRFLAGVAAGQLLQTKIDAGELKTEDAKVGYIGAYPYAEVISGYTSWYLGVKAACPTATMMVVYTNSWYNETAEKESANSLIQKGCVLLSQHADSYGAPTACEEAGIPNVSYNGSTKSVAPTTYIISSRINWEPYYDYAIKCMLKGEKIDTDWCGTIATGSVELTELNTDVAVKGTDEVIESMKRELTDGTRHVFDTSTFTVNGATLDTYEANVIVDEAFTPDTQVISDGFFNESSFRSAPYFDVIIDGITIVE